MKEKKMNYEYEWVGIGLLITDIATGRDVLVRGQAGEDLLDELDDCWCDDLRDYILEEYV